MSALNRSTWARWSAPRAMMCGLLVATAGAATYVGCTEESSGDVAATRPCETGADCDDGRICTVDHCAPVVGCVYTYREHCVEAEADAEPNGDADSGFGGGGGPVTLGAIDEFLPTGLCPPPRNYEGSTFDLAYQLLVYTRNGVTPVTNDDLLLVDGLTTTAEAAVSGSTIDFSLPAQCDASFEEGPGHVCVDSATGDWSAQSLGLYSGTSRFEPPGGESRRFDDRLVVLLVDHSGSMKGQPDPNSPVELGTATDPNDARITLLKNLVTSPSIPPATNFSLVWFNARQPHITQEFATPTRNREVMVCPTGASESASACRENAEFDGLSRLERGESDGTPLVDALDQTYNIVIAGNRTISLNPVVVLVTDGTENGDTSGSGRSLGEVASKYSEHTYNGFGAPVPVIVVHLQPTLASGWPRGRDAALYELACATGGEYFFVEHPEDLYQDDDVEIGVLGRLFGTWRLSLSADELVALEPGGWLLGADARFRLGERARTAVLQRSPDPSRRDTRLLFRTGAFQSVHSSSDF